MVCEDVSKLVGFSMELASDGVSENGGGRGLVMALKDESMGMLGPGGQPVPECLLGCGVLLLVVGIGDGFEEGVG